MGQVKSPIQIEDLGGEMKPKGTAFMCEFCRMPGTTRVDMYLLPQDRLVCDRCCE